MSGTNPVALYTKLNNTTVADATTYKAEIDANSVAAARVVNQFAPHALASPNMTIQVEAGSIFTGITLTEVAQQTSGTITAPSGSNKRIDRAVIDASSGVLSIITGTPTAGTPSAPAITAGKLPIAQIGTTSAPLLVSTTAITNSMIVDERNFWGLPTSGVTAGAYTNANITVDAEGRVTAASNGASVTYNAISGCLPSAIAGSHTTATITVSSGQAADSTNATYLISAGYSWAAANGNAINGTDAASSTLANSTTYHMFLCSGGSGTGTFCSASLTPTFPTGYTTSKRRIFSFNTDSSGNPIPYTAIETEGGSMVAWLTTQVLDINVANLSNSPRTLYTLTVPTGIKVGVMYRGVSATNITFIYTSPDETDVAPATLSTTVPQFDAYPTGNTGPQGTPRDGLLTTNTSGQIAVRAQNASSTFYHTTRGFKDFRRS